MDFSIVSNRITEARQAGVALASVLPASAEQWTEERRRSYREFAFAAEILRQAEPVIGDIKAHAEQLKMLYSVDVTSFVDGLSEIKDNIIFHSGELCSAVELNKPLSNEKDSKYFCFRSGYDDQLEEDLRGIAKKLRSILLPHVQ